MNYFDPSVPSPVAATMQIDMWPADGIYGDVTPAPRHHTIYDYPPGAYTNGNLGTRLTDDETISLLSTAATTEPSFSGSTISNAREKEDGGLIEAASLPLTDMMGVAWAAWESFKAGVLSLFGRWGFIWTSSEKGPPGVNSV